MSIKTVPIISLLYNYQEFAP